MLDTIIDETFFSPEELAKKFKISLSSVYKLVRSGQIPSLRLGKIYRIPSSELSRTLKDQEKNKPGSATIPRTVRTFIDHLKKEASLSRKIEEIYLYGSYARGDYDEDSDVDLCLVASGIDKTLRRKINELVEKAMNDEAYRELISLRLEEADSWERMRKNHYPLVQNILREGIPLWKNH